MPRAAPGSSVAYIYERIHHYDQEVLLQVPDVLGYRAKMAVVAPSTNTVVEPDFYSMAPAGVTFHMGRIYISNPTMTSDQEFEQLMVQIRASLDVALRDVVTCQPDYVIMGMSSETFWDGREGNRRLVERMERASGLRVSTGAAACDLALQALGVKRVAVLSPYQPIGDEQVRRFFADCGYEVIRCKGLRCPTPTSIAQVEEPILRNALRELDGPDVDAIIQVGTNLSMVRLADEAERWLDKPVLAINAAILWHALRSFGIGDQMHGFGSLLRDH